MLKAKKPKPASPEPAAQVQKGQTIHLSLFDPSLPELELGGKSTGSCGGRSLCQCEVQVRETDDDGFVISLPSCDQNRECMQEHRVLYALVNDVKRSSFLTTVQPFGEGLNERDGMVRLSHPQQVTSCQKRSSFRAKVFPKRYCLVYAWPIKTAANAETAVQAYVNGAAWDDARLPPASQGPAGRAVLLDMSARGLGLAVGVTPQFAAPMIDSLLLLRCHLDASERPLVCPVRVRWAKPLSDTVTRLGVEMILKTYPRLETLIDSQIGPWLTAMEREQLSSRPVEVKNDAG